MQGSAWKCSDKPQIVASDLTILEWLNKCRPNFDGARNPPS